MQRRLALALVALSLVATALAAAFVSTSAPRHVTLATRPSEADHVTLYENGLAAIELRRSFNATTQVTTLDLPLPPTAIFDSLTLAGDGVAVREMRSALDQTSGIHAGDTVTVHVGDQSYHGLVQAIDGGTLALRSDKGLTYVPTSQATVIEVEEAGATDAATPEPAPGALDASITVESAPGVHDVTVTYLAQGPGWTPSYRLDEDSGALTYFATLTGLDDWHDVSLDLVSGSPHVVYEQLPHAAVAPGVPAAMPAKGAAVSFGSSFAPSEPMGELHRYHYDGALDVSRGETVRLVVAQGNVTLERHFLEAATSLGCCADPGSRQDVAVLEKLRFRNALGEPLSPGTVRVYKDGDWVGEDTLPDTAPGDEANVTVAQSDEVKATLTLASHDALPSSDRWSYQLTVTSHAGDAKDLRVALEAPSYRTTITSESPGAAVEGTTATWDATLVPGASGTYVLAFETQKY
jgi:hypothetical protein